MWKKHFTVADLKIGHKYFKADLINNFKYENNKIITNVDNYLVSIEINDSKIISMECECSKKACIHEVAALYYFDSLQNSEYLEFLLSFTHAELIDFLKIELSKNEELLNSMKLYKNADVSPQYYRDKLKSALLSYDKVIDFVEFDLNKLKLAGEINLLLELLDECVRYIDVLSEEHMYDEYDSLIEEIGNLLNSLIDMNYISQTAEFLEYFILNSDDFTLSDYFSWIYERIGNPEELFDS